MSSLTWKNVTVRLGQLQPWNHNPRQSTKKQAARILASFEEFGQVQTIAIGPDGEVYDGHQRLSALLTIHGPEFEVDARQASRALTEQERRKLVATLHAGAVGSWDWDALSSWQAPDLMDWGFDAETLTDWRRDVGALGNLLDSEGVPHVAFNSGNNEWYTPPEIIEAARAVLGEIDLDPASSDIANQTVRATRYFTKSENGLWSPWVGRVWMNPPYSQPDIVYFAEKWAHERKQGNITAGAVLVNNATETGWFDSLLEVSEAVCFIHGCVKFLNTDGDPDGAPLQGQAVLYCGDSPDLFAEVFGKFGAILERMATAFPGIEIEKVSDGTPD